MLVELETKGCSLESSTNPFLPPSQGGLGKLNELMLIKCFQIIR